MAVRILREDDDGVRISAARLVVLTQIFMVDFTEEYRQVERDLDGIISGLKEDLSFLRGRNLADDEAWSDMKRELDTRLKRSRQSLDDLIRPL